MTAPTRPGPADTAPDSPAAPDPDRFAADPGRSVTDSGRPSADAPHPGDDPAAPAVEDVRARLEAWLGDTVLTPEADLSAPLLDLGVDSLDLIRTARRVEAAFGVRVQLRELAVPAMTTARLAELVAERAARRRTADTAPPGAGHGPVALTPPQEQAWEEQSGDRGHWNQALLFTTRSGLDGELFAEAVRRLVAGHASLRLTVVAPPPAGPASRWRPSRSTARPAPPSARCWTRSTSPNWPTPTCRPRSPCAARSSSAPSTRGRPGGPVRPLRRGPDPAGAAVDRRPPARVRHGLVVRPPGGPGGAVHGAGGRPHRRPVRRGDAVPRVGPGAHRARPYTRGRGGGRVVDGRRPHPRDRAPGPHR